MITKTVYFVLHANCILVKGKTKSTICDLQSQRYKVIPNLLHDILAENRKNAYSFEQLLTIYSKEDKGLKLHLTFLEKEDFGFFTDLNPRYYFPALSKVYEYPGKISNSIIDYNNKYDHRLLKLFVQHLNLSGCSGVQVRIYCRTPIKIIRQILSYLIKTNISHISLLIPSSQNDKEVIKACLNTQRVGLLILHGSKNEKNYLFKVKNNALQVVNSKQKIDSCHSCGIIDKKYFVLEQTSFIESLSFNSCLNEKISVDEEGFIKNCPSMKKHFGNIKDKYNFDKVINNKSFQEYWKITKDKIEECKMCEYRYMCQDCRAYTLNSETKISKPLKCNYNPINGTYT